MFQKLSDWVRMILLALLLPSVSAAAVEDALDATCRITAGNGMGSGIVFGEGGQYTFVMTNAHVVESAKTVTCEFWRAGHQSAKLPGQVYSVKPEIDAACILVPTAAFGPIKPNVRHFAPVANWPKIGEMITSAGCAKGAWVSAWQGHVTGYADHMMQFLPPPENGRSGSAILNSKGQIVGLLRVRIGQQGGEQVGGAVDLPTLWGGLSGSMVAARDTFKPAAELCQYLIQCPPSGNFPGGSCGPGTEDRFGRGLRPQPAAPIGGGNPWPGLTPMPESPRVDLSPILDRLDRIGDRMQSGPPAPSAPSGPDPSVLRILDQLGSQTQKNADDITKVAGSIAPAIDTAIKPLAAAIGDQGTKLKTIDEATSLLQKAHAKLEADAEAGGVKGVAARSMERLAEDPTTWIKHALIVLAIGGGIAFGVIQLLNGRGLVAKGLEKAADATGNPLLERLHNRLDGIESKINGVNVPILSGALHAAGGAFGGAVSHVVDAAGRIIPIAAGAIPGVGPIVAGASLAGAATPLAADVAREIKDHITALFTPAPGQAPASTAPAPAVVNVHASTPA